MTERIAIEALMQESGVKFGTSGARGLVSAMTDRVCVAYTLGFLQHLKEAGRIDSTTPLAVGGDRRPSSPRIMGAALAAGEAFGLPIQNLGLLPSPAVAQHGIDTGAVTVMVTGSHIPADRNGMKFTTQLGEVTKADEAGIRRQTVELPDIFDAAGMLKAPAALPEELTAPGEQYLKRYLEAFPANCLTGTKLGVYGHSAVGRDLLVELYGQLGAEIVKLGFSEAFIPVDTEAIRPEDVELAAGWAKEYGLDAIVSTDGDSDRPLISDEQGVWFRGDVAGIHTARFFGADGVATPVSCNGALELSQSFKTIARTRIGSPFVIEAMEELAANGRSRVVGYEANGGFLHVSPLPVPEGGELAPLPTRDPIIVHLALLLAATRAGIRLSELGSQIPKRVTASGRDTSFDTDKSKALLSRLAAATTGELAALLKLGPVTSTNSLDGLRVTFESGEVIHLRPSGNAPELRCYSECADDARAAELVQHGLDRARTLS